MATQNKRLTARHHAVIVELVKGHQLAEISAATGVGIPTIMTWKNQPLFSTALNEALDQARRHGTESLKSHVQSAADYLGKAVRQSEINNVGVRAAESILDRVGLSPVLTSGGAPGEGQAPMDRAQILKLLKTLPPGLLKEALNANKGED